jgi:hypothetical protein
VFIGGDEEEDKEDVVVPVVAVVVVVVVVVVMMGVGEGADSVGVEEWETGSVRGDDDVEESEVLKVGVGCSSGSECCC